MVPRYTYLNVCRTLITIAAVCMPISALAQAVVIVKGTASAPPGAERRTAERVSERLGTWLTDLDIPHRVITDEAVIAGRLAGAKVALLGYNPQPTPSELKQLKQFLNKGGKLIVCYSSSEPLAAMMGFSLGRYKSNRHDGGWSSFQFVDGPRHSPNRVYQRSWNIRPALPASSSASVAAWWYNAKGVRLADPAWVKSRSGYWMSHVLLRDDAENKKHMLVALIGQWVPSAWQQAGATYRNKTIGRYPSSGAAIAAIRKAAPQNPTVEILLTQSTLLEKQLQTSFRKGDYPTTISSARELESMLTQAFACTIPTRHKEFRGIWDHSGMGLYPGGWEATCAVLARNGITAVFPNLMWSASAHYKSAQLPESDNYRAYGDQLTACLKAAKRHKLEVHVWKVCWSLQEAPPAVIEKLRLEKRLQVTDNGKTISWLCPSNPKNHAMELAGIKEMAHKPVTGIHLDYIRYRDLHSCYCAGCKTRFQRASGITIARWPKDVISGTHTDTFLTWRAGNITRFVADTRKATRAINRKLILSAAVFGSYPSCARSVAQDWGSWLESNLVDFVCPMNYSTELAEFDKYVSKQLALPNSNGRIYPGIGIRATESYLDPVDTLEQIQLLRQRGASGFLLFELKSDVPREILPILSIQATRPQQRR